MIDLKSFRKKHSLTQSDLSDMINVTAGAIAKMELGKLAIPQRLLDALREKYDDIDDFKSDIITKGERKIPLFDDVIAYASPNLSIIHNGHHRGMLISVGDLLPGAEGIIRIAGNSMLPKYGSGSLLGIRRINNVTEIDYGNVYVVETQDNRFIKRLFKSDNGIALYSDNIMEYDDGPRKGMPMYEPIELKYDDIKRLFKVTGTISANDHSPIPMNL